MKLKKTLLLLISLALLINCSSEEKTTEDLSVKKSQPKENFNLKSVEKNLIIENSELIEGKIPPSNKKLDFSLEKNKIIGLPKYGFDIVIKSTEKYSGIYFQLKSKDGNEVSDNYFNISTTKSKGSSAKKELSNKTSIEEEKTTINVLIDATILPELVCGLIYIYDELGNVSNSEEICITIPPLGGNKSIIGNWKLQKKEFTLLGESFTQLDNQELCYIQPYLQRNYENLPSFDLSRIKNNCINAENLIPELGKVCSFFSESELTINSDNSTVFSVTNKGKLLSLRQTSMDCELVLINSLPSNQVKNKNLGYWIYNQEKQIFTNIVETTLEQLNENDPFTETEIFSDENELLKFTYIVEYKVIRLTANELVLVRESVEKHPETLAEIINKTTYYYTK